MPPPAPEPMTTTSECWLGTLLPLEVDHLPACLVAIPAVRRIAVIALHAVQPDEREESLTVGTGSFARRELLQQCGLLLEFEGGKIAAKLFATGVIDHAQPGGVALLVKRSERSGQQLVHKKQHARVFSTGILISRNDLV